MAPVRRMVVGFTVTCIVSMLAVAGYCWNGWSFSDSFYMVVITIFGVGYGEVQPVSTPALRLITIGVIFFGTAAAVYTVGGFVQFLIGGELNKVLGVRRMQHDIEHLKNHVIICGYGRMGTILAQSLSQRKRGILVIDNDPIAIRDARAAGYLALEGNATEEDVLRAAAIDRASVLAAVLPNDAANVFLTITAHDLNMQLQIFARAEQPTTVKKLKQVGASQVISPTQIGADRLAHLILHPSAESLLQHAKLPEGINQDLQAIGLQLDELALTPGSPLSGKTVKEVRTQEGHTFLIVAIRHADGRTLVAPTVDQPLREGDVLFVLGQGCDIESLCKRYALQSELKDPNT